MAIKDSLKHDSFSMVSKRKKKKKCMESKEFMILEKKATNFQM